mmetsp:Transcript_14328/g.41033  ORF Transcript_14328/g.41033 Transcript_14328/m.41033 type:complete len:366 (+) Transcript_14328:427-1524(+)
MKRTPWARVPARSQPSASSSASLLHCGPWPSSSSLGPGTSAVAFSTSTTPSLLSSCRPQAAVAGPSSSGEPGSSRGREALPASRRTRSRASSCWSRTRSSYASTSGSGAPSPRKPEKDSTTGQRCRSHQSSAACRSTADFSRRTARQAPRRSLTSSCLLAARLRRWISFVSLSFLAAAPATAARSAWKSSSQERRTPASISRRPWCWRVRSRAWRRPAWKAPAASEASPSRHRAAAAEALQETASRRASKALGASRRASSRSRPTFPSASWTRSFGGRRATTASMGTQRRPLVAEGPAELQRTLEGLPRQPSDCIGKRSALPSNRSSSSSLPTASAEAFRCSGSHASFSSRRERPGTNWSSSRAS